MKKSKGQNMHLNTPTGGSMRSEMVRSHSSAAHPTAAGRAPAMSTANAAMGGRMKKKV